MVRVGSDEDVVLVEELWLRVFVEFPLREGKVAVYVILGLTPRIEV